MPQRELWVDYAKAIGILLVVYGHVARGVFQAGMHYDSEVHYSLDGIIYSFHMPLFFFLSGLFYIQSLRKRAVLGIIANKTETILYPYVVWSLLQGGIQVFLSDYTNNYTSLEDVLTLFWAPRMQFWFLYTLFLFSIIGAVIFRGLNSKFYSFVFIVSSILYLMQNYFPSYKILNYILLNFVFFSMGIFVYEKNLFFIFKNRYIFLLTIILFGLVHYFLTLNKYLFSSESEHFSSLLVAIVSIIFVSSFGCWLSKIKINWLAIIGRYSLAIYLMHVLIASGVRILFQSFFDINNAYIQLFLGTFLGIFTPILIMLHMNKYIRFLFQPPVSFLNKQ